MVTRKCVRDAVQRKKIDCYICEFHPIMQAVAQFLSMKDCAHVANLNRDFSVKTWIVVLRCSDRVNEYIRVNKRSWAWIEKYSQELRYQKLRIADHFGKFAHYRISRVDTLLVEYCQCKLRLPQVRELRLSNYTGEVPDWNGLERLICVHSFVNVSTFPSTLQCLYLDCWSCDISKFPKLPVLKCLTIANCEDLQGIACLGGKCQSIETLVIKDDRTGRSDVEGLQGLNIYRLVLDIKFLTDLRALKEVRVQRLVLKNCAWLTNKEIAKLKSIPNKTRV